MFITITLNKIGQNTTLMDMPLFVDEKLTVAERGVIYLKSFDYHLFCGKL